MMVCEENYAAVLAFSFLDDLQQEFLTQYPKQAIEKVVRPYSFIEFGKWFLSFMSKTKAFIRWIVDRLQSRFEKPGNNIYILSKLVLKWWLMSWKAILS